MNRRDGQHIEKKVFYNKNLPIENTNNRAFAFDILYYTLAPCTKNDFNSTYINI